METQWLPVSLVVWITALALTLDARQQARFVKLCTGLLFARGRRTVTSWLRGCAAGGDYKRYYYLLGSVGRKTPAIAAALLRILQKRLPGDGPGTPLVFAIDDSPTKRYGPHIEGAGKHHNPTPGPAGSKFLYGHVWVCLARLVRHPSWGTIALPILSHLYIRAKDVGWMAAYYGWQFQHQAGTGRRPGRVAGRAIGARSPADLGRDRRGLRQAAVLEAGAGRGRDGDQPAAVRRRLVVVAAGGRPRPKRGRGRPPKYGKERIDLAKRAAQSRGWQTGLFSLYGRPVVKKYKTFLATYKPVGGVIRVVLVREPDRWVAYFSTDPDLSVASILETVADRSALEQVFHDVKEVHGAGQQQLRHVWANVGAWNLIGWWHTLVELWAWDRPTSRSCDRSDSPWDKAERRPSHANRCQELRREAMQEEYSSLPSVAGLRRKNPPVHSAPHAPRRMRLTILGKCSEVGDSVKRVRPGDRVAAQAKLPCGSCSFCLEGKNHLCRKGPIIGFQLPGCFAERALLPEIALVRFRTTGSRTARPLLLTIPLSATASRPWRLPASRSAIPSRSTDRGAWAWSASRSPAPPARD